MPVTTRKSTATSRPDNPSVPEPVELAPVNGRKGGSKRQRANTASQATSAAVKRKKKEEDNDNMEVDVVDAVGDLNLEEDAVEERQPRPKREQARKPAAVKPEKSKRRSAAEVEAASQKLEEQEKRFKKLRNLELTSFAKLEMKQKYAEMKEDIESVSSLPQQLTQTQRPKASSHIMDSDNDYDGNDQDDNEESEKSTESGIEIIEDEDYDDLSENEDNNKAEESAYNSEDELQRPKGKAKRGETKALIEAHKKKMEGGKKDVVVKKTASAKIKTSNLSIQQRPSHLSGIQPAWHTKSADVKFQKQKQRQVTPTSEDEFELGGLQDADVESAPPPQLISKKNIKGVKFQPSVILIQSDSEDATPVKKKASKIAKTPTTVKCEPAAKTAQPTVVKGERKKARDKVSQALPPPPVTFGHNDLTEFPPFLDTAKWRTVVLPTLYQQLNSSTEPFSAFASTSHALVGNVKAVLTKIFPGHTYTPTLTSHVVKLACKRLTEQRGTFGSTALEIVDSFFSQEEFKDSPTTIASYVEWAVRPNGPAFWAHPEPQSVSDAVQVKPDGFCQSRFVLETVTPFLNVKGAVGDFGKPIGAFGLAVGAIERAFSLYETGAKPSKDNIEAFSGDKNGGIVQDYIHNIKKFSEGRWARVLADVPGGAPVMPVPTSAKVTASVARVRRNLFTPSSPPPESS